MAKITVTTNRLISKAMHRPITTDGYVLYTKVKGYKGESEGGELVTKSESNPEYVKKSELYYNSPTNIRRLFITGSGVTVQYYAGPVANKESRPLWNSTKYKEYNLFEVGNKIMNFQSANSQYMMEKAINSNAKAPDRYTVNGNGIGVITNPYTCNNIEEIYFDWTLLMSSEAAPYFSGFNTMEHYLAFMNKSTQFTEYNNDTVINYFSAFNSGGVKNIRKRFPRLRLIAMISNLDDVLEHPEMNKVGLSLDDIEQGNQTWYSANKQLIQMSNSLVMLGNLSQGISNPNTEFIVKSNQYKFDFDKLDGIVKSYISKVENYKRQKKYSSVKLEKYEELNNGIEMNIIEKRLVELENELGDNKKLITSILQYAVNGSGLNKKELEKILRQFTKDNRNRFAKMIGIQL